MPFPFTFECLVSEALDEFGAFGSGHFDDVFPLFVSLQHFLRSTLQELGDITVFEDLPHTINIL